MLHINDGASGAPGSVYDLENARLTTLTMGYSSGGGGQQTITVEAEHLKINGLAAY